MMSRCLELFKGTGSVGRVMEKKGYEVVSLDINPKAKATHTCDILEFDYKQYPIYYFDVIWASPLCSEYSKIKGIFGQPRNLEFADSLVKKTLEIIDYFKPKAWFIENPQTGLLKTRDFMTGIPFIDCDYCQFGFDYRKRTRFWTNVVGLENQLCNPKTCPKVKDGRHIFVVCKPHLAIRPNQKDSKFLTKQNERYKIPEPLLEYLFSSLP